MSYIHCSYNNHYWFIGDLRNFFQELVVQPFEDHLFSYDSLIDGSPDSRNFYFDILSNELSAFSNDPFESPFTF